MFRKDMIKSIKKGWDIFNLFSPSWVVSITRHLFMSPSSVNTKFSFPFFIDLKIHWCRSWTVPLWCNRPHMWGWSCNFLFINMYWCLKDWTLGQQGIYSTSLTSCSFLVLAYIKFYLTSERIVCWNLLQIGHRLGNLWKVASLCLPLSRLVERLTQNLELLSQDYLSW